MSDNEDYDYEPMKELLTFHGAHRVEVVGDTVTAWFYKGKEEFSVVGVQGEEGDWVVSGPNRKPFDSSLGYTTAMAMVEEAGLYQSGIGDVFADFELEDV